MVNQGTPEPWTVSPEPVLRIGTPDGGEGHDLFRVRDARSLDDGRVVVANDGTQEIRVFDSMGRLLGRWGRRGEGPGEFLTVSGLDVTEGGDIRAWDALRRTMSIFSRDGTFLESTRMGDGFEPGLTTDILPDGRLLTPRMNGYGLDTPDGLHRRELTWVLYNPLTDRTVSYGVWPGFETYVETAGTAVRGAILPFAPASDGAADDAGRIHIGDGALPELRTYDDTGELTRIARWQTTSADADPVVATLRAEALANADGPEARRFIEAQYDAVPRGRPLPAFVQIRAGWDGELWIQDFPMPGAATVRWDVLGRDGTHRATVAVPSGFSPTQIGEDFLLGTMRGALGVEQVLRYRLLRR